MGFIRSNEMSYELIEKTVDNDGTMHDCRWDCILYEISFKENKRLI